MENKAKDPDFKVFVEGDACHFVYYNEISTQSILSSQAQVVNLLNQQKIDILPFIIDLSHIDDQGVKVEVRDFGKIISSRSLFDRCSGVWIVGTKGITKVLSTILNKSFLEGRIHIVDDLEQAKKEAKALKNVKIPMLEQDLD